MPNLIPDWLPWMRPAGRLIWSIVFFLIGLIIIFVLMRRPKPDRPATWAECIAGAVGVFGMMTLAYAVIPHEWITFSDKYLQWDTTVFVFRSNQKMLFFPWNWPFSFDKHNIRDIIVVVIYGIVDRAQPRGSSSAWQKRGRRSRRRQTATAADVALRPTVASAPGRRRSPVRRVRERG